MAAEHIDAVVTACSTEISARDASDLAERRENLFHLTDTDGFSAILSGKCLWASLATALNDASEARYGIELAVELLRERTAAGGDAFDLLTLQYLLDPSSAPPRNQFELYPLVISFCGRLDRSGMWLHYGRAGRGIAIGFAPHIAQALNMNLSRIDYDRKSQRARIADLVDAGKGALGPNPTPEELHEGAHIASLYMLWLAIRMKHPAFAEEDEWRLSVQAIAHAGAFQDDTVLKYRRTGERLVPYEEHAFADINLVREVIVGYSSPTDPDAIRLALRDRGSAATVSRSTVPVR
jgi:hypothetical protein